MENLEGGRRTRKGVLEKAEICELSLPNFILQSPGPRHACATILTSNPKKSYCQILPLYEVGDHVAPIHELLGTQWNYSPHWRLWQPCIWATSTSRNAHASPEKGTRETVYLWALLSAYFLLTNWTLDPRTRSPSMCLQIAFCFLKSNIFMCGLSYKRIKCQPTRSLSSSSLCFHWKS